VGSINIKTSALKKYMHIYVFVLNILLDVRKCNVEAALHGRKLNHYWQEEYNKMYLSF